MRLLGYVGDDLTGSVDVMEALTVAGISTALFVDAPTPEELAAVDASAVGIASVARTLPPRAIAQTLPPLLHALRAWGAPRLLYKICSTFDSAPHVGSIGAAVDAAIASGAGSAWIALFVAAPRLGRYCAFGNLFARSGYDSDIYRLDRHPTMRNHPATPMDEADLRVHLSRQTGEPIGLVDALDLAGDDPVAAVSRERAAGARIILFDALTAGNVATVGNLIAEPGLLAVGSAGVAHALTAHWVTTGVLPHVPAAPPAGPVQRVLAVAGSCSPVTARQIGRAVAAGYTEIPMPDLAGPVVDRAVAEATEVADAALAAGRSVVVHSRPRIGPDGVAAAVASAAPAQTIGAGLAAVAARMLDRVDRLVVAGGDTSGYVLRGLGVRTLRVSAPFAPAMPFCRGHRRDGTDLGVELMFKGGQTGDRDFLLDVRSGRIGSARHAGSGVPDTPIRERTFT